MPVRVHNGYDLYFLDPFRYALELLQHAAEVVGSRGPRVFLIIGDAGTGKTTVAQYFCEHWEPRNGAPRGVYVEAVSPGAAGSPYAMLVKICRTLTAGSAPQMPWDTLEEIQTQLAETNRFLVIDNAHHIAKYRGGAYRALDTVRAIHDHSLMPLVLLGLPDLESRWNKEPEFRDRRLLTYHMPIPSRDQVAEILPFNRAVADLIYDRAEGNLRRITLATTLLESACNDHTDLSPGDLTPEQAARLLGPLASAR